ncbi:hypothetical protein HMSSN036_23780 [Paenibacillus macerans]|nr:hypothetical protein HMSSN036_23780 [Paenibacillus macerans]
MANSPKVSVFMVAYNHEKYIRQAIESVIFQETNFHFELIISEDHSTDRTAEIIHEYHVKYPNIIKPIYNSENIGAIRNFSKIIEVCSGEYTAILDGDDYWTTFNKLQEQVEFMDKHSFFSISYHKTKAFYEDGAKESFTIPYKNEVAKLTIIDLFNDYFLPSSSVMFRTGLIRKFPDWFFDMPFGDRPLYIFNAHFGDIGYLDKEMSAYRLHQGGIWSLSHYDKMEYYLSRKIEMLKQFNQYFNGIYEIEIKLAISRYETSLIVENEKGKVSSEMKDFIKTKNR